MKREINLIDYGFEDDKFRYDLEVNGIEVTVKVNSSLFDEYAKDEHFYFEQVSEDTFVHKPPTEEEYNRDRNKFFLDYYKELKNEIFNS